MLLAAQHNNALSLDSAVTPPLFSPDQSVLRSPPEMISWPLYSRSPGSSFNVRYTAQVCSELGYASVMAKAKLPTVRVASPLPQACLADEADLHSIKLREISGLLLTN